MTKEEKRLLLKDLCVRLPYYTMVLMGDGAIEPLVNVNVDTYICDGLKGLPKPYLRPMSSMTEEGQGALDSMCYGVEMVSRLSGLKMFDKAFDWLNAHHFDYRGLIEKGLALEAPEDMYKTE